MPDQRPPFPPFPPLQFQRSKFNFNPPVGAFTRIRSHHKVPVIAPRDAPQTPRPLTPSSSHSPQDRGRNGTLTVPPLPPNRTGGFPASGFPVRSWLLHAGS
jgi:hypothetical protein